MTLGIVSLFVLGFITGPIAWVMGNSALKAIDSGRANPADRDSASIGRTCGIIGTGLHSLGLIAYIAYTVFIYSTMWHAMNTIQSSMPVQQPPTVSSPTN